MSGGVALLAADNATARAVYRRLSRRHDVRVLVETRPSAAALARRRLRRLGPVRVGGQVLFQMLTRPLLASAARGRRDEIARAAGLDVSPFPPSVARVESVNSDAARQWLREADPAVVVLSGTRVVSPETLRCVPAPFVNMHAGITPDYRGAHGAYWALAQGRSDHVGTTVHLVDEGIDTGPVLAQASFEVTRRDNFESYPLLHVAAGLPLLERVVDEIVAGKVPAPMPSPPGKGRLWTHPTLWGYWVTRWTKGVR